MFRTTVTTHGSTLRRYQQQFYNIKSCRTVKYRALSHHQNHHQHQHQHQHQNRHEQQYQQAKNQVRS